MTQPTARPQRTPGTGPPRRDGHGRLERQALEHFRLCLPAVPARTLAHVALWPETILQFAEWAGVRAAHAYNTLSQANRRPYHAIRTAYARRLGLSKDEIDLVLDRPKLPLAALPSAVRRLAWPAPPREASELDLAGPTGSESLRYRDGSAALERLALRRAEENLAALPKGMVLQLLHWPYSLKELANAINVGEQDLYNMLSFQRGMRYQPVRERLCAFLEIEPAELDHLVETPAADPVPLPAASPPPPQGKRRRGG